MERERDSKGEIKRERDSKGERNGERERLCVK